MSTETAPPSLEFDAASRPKGASNARLERARPRTPARVSPRRGRRCDLRRCTMTPMISTAPTSTTASTEKLAMAASFHTSGVSSTYLPADCTEMRSARRRPAHIRDGGGGWVGAYRCCSRASWGTSCTTRRARRRPGPSSRTPSCCTDLRTQNHQVERVRNVEARENREVFPQRRN